MARIPTVDDDLNLPAPTRAALAGSPELTGTFATPAVATAQATSVVRTVPGAPPRAAGAICFTWDDGFPVWDTIAREAVARGQQHTFAVQTGRIGAPDGVTPAQIASWAAMGHEIAAHSVEHKNMALATVAERDAEFDNSKAALEAILGPGTVTTWVYPRGSAAVPSARNLTTDKAAYGRYDRLLDTNFTSLTPMEDRIGMYLVPRRVIHEDEIEGLIRLAATQPVLVCLYGHNPGGVLGGLTEPTVADVLRWMDLAADLGVPCVTTRDAFPGAGTPLANPHFATGKLDGWRVAGDPGAVTVVPAVNPPAGLRVSHVARITTATTQPSVIKQMVPVKPGRSYTLTYRARLGANGAGGTLDSGGGIVQARLYKTSDHAGMLQGGWDVSSSALSFSGGDKSGAWNTLTATYTIPAGMRFLEIAIMAYGQAGVTAEFCHIWFGETSMGDFG